MPQVQTRTDRAARDAAAVSPARLREINVVPLVDVMLVLLIIFMVTAPMIQRGIDVNLPVAARPRESKASGWWSPSRQLTARIGRCYLGDEQIRADVLQERVRQKMETATSKQVYLRGDGTSCYYQELMDVFDRLKAAGVEKVGLVTKAARRTLMDVTDVLRDRMQEPAGLQRMVTVSALMHGIAILGLLFAPKGFLAHGTEAPRAIMTISLGGGGDGTAKRRDDVDRRPSGAGSKRLPRKRRSARRCGRPRRRRRR